MYYQETRKHQSNIKAISKVAQQRADERRINQCLHQNDPAQEILLEGRSIKLLKNLGNVKYEDGLISRYQDKEEILYDRFDVRAHMDYIPSANENERWLKRDGGEEVYNNLDDSKFTTQNPSLLQTFLNYERYRSILNAYRRRQLSIDTSSEHIGTIQKTTVKEVTQSQKILENEHSEFLDDVEYSIKKRLMILVRAGDPIGLDSDNLEHIRKKNQEQLVKKQRPRAEADEDCGIYGPQNGSQNKIAEQTTNSVEIKPSVQHRSFPDEEKEENIVTLSYLSSSSDESDTDGRADQGSKADRRPLRRASVGSARNIEVIASAHGVGISADRGGRGGGGGGSGGGSTKKQDVYGWEIDTFSDLCALEKEERSLVTRELERKRRRLLRGLKPGTSKYGWIDPDM